MEATQQAFPVFIGFVRPFYEFRAAHKIVVLRARLDVVSWYLLEALHLECLSKKRKISVHTRHSILERTKKCRRKAGELRTHFDKFVCGCDNQCSPHMHAHRELPFSLRCRTSTRASVAVVAIACCTSTVVLGARAWHAVRQEPCSTRLSRRLRKVSHPTFFCPENAAH